MLAGNDTLVVLNLHCDTCTLNQHRISRVNREVGLDSINNLATMTESRQVVKLGLYSELGRTQTPTSNNQARMELITRSTRLRPPATRIDTIIQTLQTH
jgi:hypothetical protein